MYICKLDSDLDDEDKNPLWKKNSNRICFQQKCGSKVVTLHSVITVTIKQQIAAGCITATFIRNRNLLGSVK